MAAHDAIRLAIFDLDGTLLTCDSLVEFQRFILVRHWRPWRWVPRLALTSFLFASGRRSVERVKEAWVGAIDALRSDEQDTVAQGFVEHLMQKRIRKPVADLVRRYATAGHHTVLLSASPDLWVERLGRQLGFDIVICTRLASRPDGGKLSTIVGCNCKGEEKVTALLATLRGQSVDWEHSFACSDHYSDLPLLRRVGTPVAVHPEHRLGAHARALGWQVMQ